MKTFKGTDEITTDSHFLSLNNTQDLKLGRRKVIKKSGFSGSGIRLKKKDCAIGGKRSGPTTPLLKWKIDGKEDVSVVEEEEEEEDKIVESGKKLSKKVSSISARKLAAGLWKLQQPEINREDPDEEVRGLQKKNKVSDRLGFEPGVGNVGSPFFFHCKNGDVGSDTKDLETPFCVTKPRNENLYKVQPPSSFSNCAMEGATKWDPGCSKTSDEVYKFYGQVKLLEDQQTAHISVVSSLQTELDQARSRIHELEIERHSSKKQVEQFLRNLKDEKASWRSREHEKVRAIIDDLKDDLHREKKTRQRLEIVNSKLVNELTTIKKSAKQLVQDYEKERKSRELMEEVCDELAKEIGDDKTEVEDLKRESMKMRAELEEERKMLQMAEVWREERVQMKLIDAKLILEKKYSQMNKLIVDLDAFLRSKSETMNSKETKEAEMLRESAKSVNIEGIKFAYEPPNSEDILSLMKDLQPGEPNENETESCLDFNPEISGITRNSVESRYSSGFVNRNEEIEEDESGWETMTHVEEGESCYSPEGSELSVNRNRRVSNASGSIKGWERNAGHETPNSVISEICSLASKQSKKRSSISRLWRSNPNNNEKCKIISVERRNERLSNARMSNVGGISSPDRRSGEGGCSSPSMMSQWSSPDLGNSRTKGTKGFMEWPRGGQRNSLKAKLLEARQDSHKYQLRHVLKQKI